jgi:hypothetical protein
MHVSPVQMTKFIMYAYAKIYISQGSKTSKKGHVHVSVCASVRVQLCLLVIQFMSWHSCACLSFGSLGARACVPMRFSTCTHL